MNKTLWTGSALLAGLLAGCGPKETHRSAIEPPKPVEASVLAIGEQETDQGFFVTGTVRAEFNTTLESKVMGRVDQIEVREGDPIRKGQLLVAIDPRELKAAVNLAGSNVEASVVAVDSATTAATMESRTSRARISQAESAVRQARAQLAAAEARRDLALAGPRTQEVQQSRIAVLQAESNLKLAKTELDRTTQLVQVGAVARRELDLAQNRYEVAKGQLDAALQAESIAKEGSRAEDIRAAEEAVRQARAGVEQAVSALDQARAAALQVDVSRKHIEVSQAQAKQAEAALRSATVGLSYARVYAPFDGRVVQRMADPGAMASPGVPLLAVEGGGLRLEVVVPESLIDSVHLGEATTVQLDALPGRTFEGRVVEIVPQGDAVAHTFLVKVAIDAGSKVKSGMFGRARVRSGTASRILIPSSATWEREGLHYVFAINDEDIARLRIVTLGETVGDHVEVLSGLGKGDRIAVAPTSRLADGDKVVEIPR